MAIPKKLTLKQLAETVEKLQQELTLAKKTIRELETKTASNGVTISRFKVFIDEKLNPIDIEAQVKKIMSSETILIGMKQEVAPITKQQRAAAVYKEFKQKQNGNNTI